LNHAPLLLTVGRCAVALSVLACAGAFAASGNGVVSKGKAPRVSTGTSEPVAIVSEPPSMALLMLGLVGIGFLGLARTHRK
jgi:hypothetical protein